MKEEKIFVTRSSMPSYYKYCEKIKRIWETHWMTNNGEMHNELEAKIKEYLNVNNISLFTNGHLALENAIKSLELSGEVITTPFTFVSTTHAISRNGLKPIFCDIKRDDYNWRRSKWIYCGMAARMSRCLLIRRANREAIGQKRPTMTPAGRRGRPVSYTHLVRVLPMV